MSSRKPRSPAASTRPSREDAESAIHTLIRFLGEDPAREGLRDTPRRVIKAFEEYTAGYAQDPADILAKTFAETGGYDGPVMVRDITFESRCEHHLAPFIGRVHIAYLPKGKIVGLSKLARLVDVYARRLQTQERMTAEIATALMHHLKPRGVAIQVEAEHFCMKLRGVHRDGAVTVTRHFTGVYLKDASLRQSFAPEKA